MGWVGGFAIASKIFKITSRPITKGQYLLEALYAGILGGSAVALFFLVADLMAGRPLFTPSLLGSVLVFGAEAKDVLSVRFDAVVYFSIVHIAAFTALGALLSFVVHEIELHSKHPAVVMLVLFGIIEAGFFVVAPLAFPGVVDVLGMPRIAAANLMAAVVLGLFFVLTHHAVTRGKFKHNLADFVFDSFYSGAIGGSVVALFFLAVDSLDGRPFFTPALIGHVLFKGATVDTAANLAFAAVPQVVIVHFLWSAAMGTIITWVVHEVELHSRHPVEVLLVLFALIEVSFLFVAPLAMPGVITQLGIVRIGIANLLAAGLITLFFLWSHQEVPGEKVPIAEIQPHDSDAVSSTAQAPRKAPSS
ncbi:MAG: hypothetical protein V3T08_00870 [Gemmatimonadota bacterium]